MTAKSIRIPGPDHPITVAPNPKRGVVSVAGRVVADTREALTLREASDHATYCPYKGDCAYYSIPAGGDRAANALWTYEAPFAAVAEIKDHLAFYPNRVDAIAEKPAA
jgi:uncharacterized protein (DUF427 family)